MLLELLIALVIAAILSAILFGVGWGPPYREGTRGGLLAWFVILLLVVWAGGVWVTPFGPHLRGVAWIPFVITGVLVLLLLFTAVPRPWRLPRTRREAVEQAEIARQEEIIGASAFGCLFWLLMFALIVVLLSRYTLYRRPTPPHAAASLEQRNRVTAARPETMKITP